MKMCWWPHIKGGNRPWGVWVEVAEFVFLSSVINHTRICPNCVSSSRQREREDVISALSKQAPRIRSQLEERIFAVRRSFWEFSWKTLVRRMFWGGLRRGVMKNCFFVRHVTSSRIPESSGGHSGPVYRKKFITCSRILGKESTPENTFDRRRHHLDAMLRKSPEQKSFNLISVSGRGGKLRHRFITHSGRQVWTIYY